MLVEFHTKSKRRSVELFIKLQFVINGCFVVNIGN